MAFADPAYSLWLLLLIGAAAVLYSSVGHGGASGYLAVMALFGLDPALMKPAALTMNIFVAALVLVRLTPAGHFNRRLFVPLVIGSTPMAFLGGAFLITAGAYKVILGVCLLLAFWRLLWERRDVEVTQIPSAWLTIPIGAVLGFVAGLTGVGGGIFLSPLLLFFYWTKHARQRGNRRGLHPGQFGCRTRRLRHRDTELAARHSVAGGGRRRRRTAGIGALRSPYSTGATAKDSRHRPGHRRPEDDRYRITTRGH